MGEVRKKVPHTKRQGASFTPDKNAKVLKNIKIVCFGFFSETKKVNCSYIMPSTVHPIQMQTVWKSQPWKMSYILDIKLIFLFCWILY